MVQYYSILGRQVGSHVLAFGTLTGTSLGIWASLRGGPAKDKAKGPPIEAKSSDEEKFIRDFIANAEREEKNTSNVRKEAAAH